MNITITVDGVQELTQAFERVERGVVDLRELGTWNWVQSEFYKVQKEIFQSGGGASKGGTWKQLSTKYAEVKNKKYGGPTRMLIASGEMYKSFSSDTGNVEKKADEMTFSFPAGYHMSKAPRSKMPLRTSLELTSEQEKRVLDPIGKKLRQLIDNAGLRDRRGF